MKGKSFRVGLLAVSCMVLMFCSIVYAADYDHEIQVQRITFSWRVDGANLHIKLAAHTKGWVAIGFNPDIQMKGARFVLGYVINGKPVVSNQFGVDNNKHEPVEKLGEKSHVTLVGGKEEGGVTTMEFSIPLVQPDSKGKKIDPNVMTTVLLAYGPDFDSFLMKHKFRIKLSVNLSTGKYKQ
jgi:DOMON domain